MREFCPRATRFVAFAALAMGGVSFARPQEEPEKVQFFEKKIRPLLTSHCYTCHSAETKPSGDLRVDDRNGLLTGGKAGSALVPGKPDESLLIKKVTSTDPKKRMPKEGGELSPEEIADLRRWIEDGAAWPSVKVPTTLGRAKPEMEKLRRDHWAWQPLGNLKPPPVQDGAWARDDVDRFIMAGLEAVGLRPVGDADKPSLIRRLTFDLWGLPPSPEECDAFLRDESSQAVPALVDRLLSSPRFGERWGRHWLDVARYGESTGPSRNVPYPHAWRYRDYVIDSINSDVPFDQFIREQIAGDLLPAKDAADRDRLLAATGFLALGVKDVNQRFKVRFVMDNVDEQIDAVSRSVLALTVTCARCHDHKFDPIPTTDYYALAGIFTSTDNCAGVRNKMGGGGLDYYDPAMLVRLDAGGAPPIDPSKLEKLKGDLAEAKKKWDEIRGTPRGLAPGSNGQPTQRPFRLEFERLQAEVAAMTDPVARGQAVHGVRESKTIADTQVRIRGLAEQLGPVVPRGFLSTVSVPEGPSPGAKESGRLELATWLSSPKNPLTARVIVNRIWQHLFGRGIVSTVDNFGSTGDHPTHPELLDYLAGRFIQEGWSVKRLVRSLVLSRVYGLSADGTAAQLLADPMNRHVWRHTSRRLDAEELRDAMLAASGMLDLSRPQGSPVEHLKMVEIRDNGPEAAKIRQEADRSVHRSVYLPLLRGLIPAALEVFDPVEQTLVTGQRDSTTVPGQALYLLNSPFIRRQSLVFAERVLGAKGATEEEILQAVYRKTLGRAPSAKESARALGFVHDYASDYTRQMAAAPREKPKAEKPKEAPKAAPAPVPANPDEIDQAGEPIVEDKVEPKDARTAAWLAMIQAVIASAEFRYLK